MKKANKAIVVHATMGMGTPEFGYGRYLRLQKQLLCIGMH
jgi:hypothetical protein